MSRRWMSHARHTKESCQAYESVMSQIRISHVTHTNDLFQSYCWCMLHLQTSHVTHFLVWYHVHIFPMSHIHTCDILHMNESCHTYVRAMSCIWKTHVTHEYLLYLSYEWDMSQTDSDSFNRRVSFVGPTCMYESCHTYTRVMSHMNVLLSFPHICTLCPRQRVSVKEPWISAKELHMSHIWMSHVTHMDGSFYAYE